MKKLVLLSMLFCTTPLFASDNHYNTLQECLKHEKTCCDPQGNNCVRRRAKTHLKPVIVHTSTVITETKNYDVYQPIVTYKKIDSFSTQKTCVTCK